MLREVERLTVYDPPHQPATGTATAAGGPPVNLLHTSSEFTGGVIIARVVFAGVDFSQRSGNYFAHTLVADGAGRPAALPVELWDAAFWESRQGSGTELPLLPEIPAPGPLNQAAVGAFLARAGTHRTARLGHLVAAADDALSGGLPVLVIDSDSTAVAHWVAAICYLLPPALRHTLTFATYSRDPLRCRTHLVGTVPDAGPFRSDLRTSFRLIDMTDEEAPDSPPHPAAAMLARLGTEAAPALWDLAGRLGAPAGDSLPACFPVLASAALLLEHELTSIELDAALEWLLSARHLAAGQAAAATRSALRLRSLDLLSEQRQASLVRLALRADPLPDASVPSSGQELASAVECRTVEQMLARLSRGETIAPPSALRTARGRAVASERCAQQLRRLPPEPALRLLAWAWAAGVTLPEDDVRKTGRDLAAALAAGDVPGGLGQAATAWPALREGIAAGLAGLSAEQRRNVFSEAAAGLFHARDFAAYPALAEEWLTRAAASHRISPASAFQQVVQLRLGQGQEPAADVALIRELWGAREWTVAEASGIAGWLPASELACEPVAEQFVRILYTVPGPLDKDLSFWWAFVRQVAARPDFVRKDARLSMAEILAPAVTLLLKATSPERGADAAMRDLVQLYDDAVDHVQAVLSVQLPPLLLASPRPGRMLAGCGAGMRRLFGDYAHTVLGATPHNVAAAAKLFLAMRDLQQARDHAYARQLDELLRDVLLSWSWTDILDIAAEANALQLNGGGSFRLWLSQYRRWPRFGSLFHR